MPALRPWSTKSSEQKWAIAVAIGCFIILITLPFWSGNKQSSENKDHQVQAPNINDIASQPAPIHTKKMPVKKTTTKPVISHTKQAPKKSVMPAKPHVTPIQNKTTSVVSKASQAYFIQVGAFQDKARATKLQKQLLKKRWPVIIQKKKRFYAVQIGPYKQKEKANRIKKQISHKEKMNGFITHHAYP